MSIYLYNLGFSVSNSMNGNFSSGGTGINASNAWFQYSGPGTPIGLNNYQGVIPQLGSAAIWSLLSAPPASFNSTENSNGGDYLFLRIFNTDGAPQNYIVRTTVIFGQGTGSSSSPSSSLQSPFIRNSTSQPVPVIDCDTPAFGIGGAPTWPAPTTDNNPISAYSSWSYCIGQINGPTSDYAFNVGASVYAVSGSNQGSYYSYGIDPRMHVSGMTMITAKDNEAA
jgi:hypothetical protein